MTDTQRRWRRYVAVGDSFTEGLWDPDPRRADEYLGWADRLADMLARRNAEEGLDFGYANLAVRGMLAADITGPQLDHALSLTPDLVSICAGGNDYLRSRVQSDAITDQLEEAVARIRETGADVLLVTAPDVSWMSLVHLMHGRLAEFTANTWSIAQRHDCHVVDIWSLRALRDPRMYAEDRIHFSTEGHQRVAAQAAWTLGLKPPVDGWTDPLPAAPPLPLLATVQANRAWAVDHLAPWVRRRFNGTSSGDGRSAKHPQIIPLAPATIDVNHALTPAELRPEAGTHP
ncbi:hypothetical protein KEM60_02931 [Austwickia sp. TVS 96-490-7B]|uniref:SGNH/GDSL hydrolase family protein n=1 Tax=Austwickia sp. TVS 96-490-7B TaxID=2830843 RepID=UPI001C57E1CA|nr:SGNH/GDSL hydrolase family protein [Austwickia sp. TVS 96-490-7B]MBW3086702.1 hypothetical protein [Austwickia sp. TVS 96-490-7B]